MGTRVTGPVAATDWAALMSEVAVALLGKTNAALSGRRKLRYRRRGSLAMDIESPDAGWFRDYEAGTGGGGSDLVQRERGCGRHEALAWLCARGGWNDIRTQP